MRRWPVPIVIALIFNSYTLAAEQTSQPRQTSTAAPLVRVNPFSPPSASLEKTNSSSNTRKQTWELNAIMLAGPASQIELDGRLMALGDRIYGYKLVIIEARRAILEKNGAREVVLFDDPPEDEDDG